MTTKCKEFSREEERACDAAEKAIKWALNKHLPGDDRFASRMLALVDVVASEFAKVECPGCRKMRLDGAVMVLRGMIAPDEDRGHVH